LPLAAAWRARGRHGAQPMAYREGLRGRPFQIQDSKFQSQSQTPAPWDSTPNSRLKTPNSRAKRPPRGHVDRASRCGWVAHALLHRLTISFFIHSAMTGVTAFPSPRSRSIQSGSPSPTRQTGDWGKTVFRKYVVARRLDSENDGNRKGSRCPWMP
jgi:hypothetical protein